MLSRPHLALIFALLTASEAMAADEPQAPGYVGSDVCASCHQDEAMRWRGSMHHLAWQPATDESVLGDFGDAAFDWMGGTVRFTRDGETFIVETAGGNGDTRQFVVVGVAGIAPLQQYLLETEPGRLQSFDIAWDIEGERWYDLYPDADLQPGDGLHWTGPYKNWNSRCAECHATGFEKNYDHRTRRYESMQAEIGVGCEACHGPGEAHVDWAADPGAYDESAWPALSKRGMTIGFSEAGAETEIQQCAGCHARREPLTASSPMPGTPFNDSYRLVLLRDGFYHADGAIRDEVYVYGSFLQSKMYAQGVRCSDCHDPHRAELRPEPEPVCVQCHSPAGNTRFASLEPGDYDSPAHHFHEAGTEGAKCVSCHMPDRVYMGVDPRRDHAFRIPRPDIASETGAPDACTGCHDNRDPAWAAAEIAKRFPASTRRGRGFPRVFAEAWRGPKPVADDLLDLAGYAELPGIVRASALDLLSGTADVSVRLRAMRFVGDPDPLVREAAVGLARGLPTSDQVRFLAQALKDQTRTVRIAAARALVTVPAAEIPKLVEDLRRTATDEWQASLVAKADFPETQLAIGGAAIALRNVGASLAAFREAVTLDPQLVPGWVMIVRIHLATNDRARARSALDRALAANPENDELRQMSRDFPPR